LIPKIGKNPFRWDNLIKTIEKNVLDLQHVFFVNKNPERLLVDHLDCL
jgi:hypothetical protein